MSSAELLTIADQCLYESKSRGRDIVTVAIRKNALLDDQRVIH